MRKNTLKNNMDSIKKVSSRIPKTINEAIDFNEDMYEDNDEELLLGDDEMEHNDEKEAQHSEENGMDVTAFIDDIRKKSLKGMAQLADNPDDLRYDTLKRIWQICDKSYNDQKQQSVDSNKNNIMNGIQNH